MAPYHSDGPCLSTASPAQMQINPRSRKSSVTAIPRPISGTSRRASSRLVYAVNQKAVMQNKIDEAGSPKPDNRSSQSLQRYSCIRNSMPPISYPRSMLPRSDSLIPYRDRTEVDLSGVQEQLHLTAFDTRSLETKEGSQSCSWRKVPTVADTRRGKSRSSNPHANEITPRSLVKPIQPFIPHSSTASQFTCFSGIQNASPSKPPRKETIEPMESCKGINKLDVIDALLESRMSRHEIETLDQVRSEALKIRKRVSNSTSGWSSNSVPSLSSTAISARPGLRSPITLNLSINDETNSQRLEKQHRNPTARRPLFVNTALANTVGMYGSSPLSYTTPESDDTCLTALSSGSTLDLRSVLCARTNAYWTGRYVATTDKLRKSDCDALLKPQGSDQTRPNVNSSEFEDRFDVLDDTRMDRVLQELKSCCKTESALTSFADFERQLRKKSCNPAQTITRSCTEVFSKQDRKMQHLGPSHETIKSVNKDLDNQPKFQASTFSTQGAIVKLSGMGIRRPSLVKSKTTGTLALGSTIQGPLTPSMPSTPKARFVEEAGIQGHNTTYDETDLKRRTQSRKGEDTKTSASKYISNETTSKTNRGSSIGPVSQNTTKCNERQSFMNPYLCSSTQVDVHSAGSTAVSTASQTIVGPLRSDPSQASIPSSSQKGRPDLAPGQDTKETVVSLKKSGSRKISGPRSGDFVKKVMGASIREVRKMSRRVGSMGWGGNVDGLSTSVSARL